MLCLHHAEVLVFGLVLVTESSLQKNLLEGCCLPWVHPRACNPLAVGEVIPLVGPGTKWADT